MILVVILGLFCPASLHAQAVESTVLIIGEEGFEGLEARIFAELRILGFNVRHEGKGDCAFGLSIWENQINKKENTALICIDSENQQVKITYKKSFAKPKEKKISILQKQMQDDQLVATQVAESVRIFFQQDKIKASTWEETYPIKELSLPKDFRFKTTVNLGVISMGPSVSVNPSVDAGFWVFLGKLSTLGVMAITGLRPVSAEKEEVSYSIFSGALGFEAGIKRKNRLYSYAAAGYMLWFLGSLVEPAPNYKGKGSFDLVTGLYGRLGLGIMFSKNIGMQLQIMGAWTFESIDYYIDDRKEKSFGQPVIQSSLGLIYFFKDKK